MSTHKKSLLVIVALIAATTGALAALQAHGPFIEGSPAATAGGNKENLTVTAEVVQEKALKASDGRVTVALTLAAAELPPSRNQSAAPTDLVIVLDRSGSMEGAKLDDARQALRGLLPHLARHDRLALISYANGATAHLPLTPLTVANRSDILRAIDEIQAGGGTNLGAGLTLGIDTLMRSADKKHQGKVILISDGLANQGITDPAALGKLAATAMDHRFSISSVGVGLDFNETLMTAIADQGAGSYHFLEDPDLFAQVFETELSAARQVAAADIAIDLPLGPGVRLLSAGGYPIRHQGASAKILPGSLLSGQEKTLYLTFAVPTDEERTITIGTIETRYRQGEKMQQAPSPALPLTVACVSDPAAVMASIDTDRWADQVVKEEFSLLKEEVAADIRRGDRQRAEERIQDYAARQTALNASLGSAKVAANLADDVQVLQREVAETFSGPPTEVASKQKRTAKAMQYDGYKKRRDKKALK